MKLRAIVLATIMVAGMFIAGCRSSGVEVDSSYLPLSEVQDRFGTLIAAGNLPTLNQGGTGERIGFFRDSNGSIWGLPVAVGDTGAVSVCAPVALRGFSNTDNLPAGTTIVGSTNAPTGWRGGTGELELVLRDADGSVRWHKIHGAALADSAKCGPRPLHYYRLAFDSARP